jgi:hypothetical protein
MKPARFEPVLLFETVGRILARFGRRFGWLDIGLLAHMLLRRKELA